LNEIESEETKKLIELAKNNPNDFVLKPQRQGGGHNFFKDEMVKQLNSLSKSELSTYILMDRICPPEMKNYFLRESSVTEGLMVGELGIFGVFLRLLLL